MGRCPRPTRFGATNDCCLYTLGDDVTPHGRSFSGNGLYREPSARLALSPNARKKKRPLSSPTNGNELPVLGNSVGAGSAGAAAAVSTGAADASVAGAIGTMTTRRAIVASIDSGGGGGILPVLLTSVVIKVSGTSVTAVAETFMPFLRENTSVCCPSTVNFVPSGTWNC